MDPRYFGAVNGRQQIPAKLVPLNDMAAGLQPAIAQSRQLNGASPHAACTTIVPPD
jgi:hypothetical protein